MYKVELPPPLTIALGSANRLWRPAHARLCLVNLGGGGIRGFPRVQKMQALHDPTTCDYDSTHDDYSVNLTLSGMPPFDAPITFHFRHRVNILAGPNGCGKSTALARLAGQPLPAWLASSFDPASRHPDLEPQDFFAGKPTVFIASTRTELDSQSIANYVRQVKNDSFVGRMLSYKNIDVFCDGSHC